MENFKASIPPGPFQAHLYDCDGTLADTMGAHVEAWVEEMGAQGVKLDGKLIYDLAGVPATGVVAEINRRYQTSFNPAIIAQAKEDRFHAHFLHRIRPIQHVVDYLKESAALGVRIAVVSGGRKRIVKETLKIIGVESLVEVLVCAEDVVNGKPHAEPFLKAAAALGVAPKDCLVFEDADLGIQSAENAGMLWVRIE